MEGFVILLWRNLTVVYKNCILIMHLKYIIYFVNKWLLVAAFYSSSSSLVCTLFAQITFKLVWNITNQIGLVTFDVGHYSINIKLYLVKTVPFLPFLLLQ